MDFIPVTQLQQMQMAGDHEGEFISLDLSLFGSLSKVVFQMFFSLPLG